MAYSNPRRVSAYCLDAQGNALPYLVGTGTRVNATAGSSSTAAAAVPAGGSVLILRATAPIWIIFGASGVGVAAADATSILFMTGEAPYTLQDGQTHFRVLRVGDADVAVQLESVATL